MLPGIALGCRDDSFSGTRSSWHTSLPVFCPILQGGEVETLPKYGASQQTFKGSAREFERGSLKRYL